MPFHTQSEVSEQTCMCVYGVDVNYVNPCISCTQVDISIYVSLHFQKISTSIHMHGKHRVCIVRISASICMHGHHGVCVFKKVSTSNNMHEVTRNRAAFHKSKPGNQESLNPLVSTPGRGFTGIYIYI